MVKVEKDLFKHARFVYKLDAFLMVYVVIIYTVKFLDQSNYTYAYISGMQEDLNLYGNELTWMGTAFSIGYIFGTLPSQILLTYVRPSLVLPVLDMIWGALVLSMAAAKTVRTIFALRAVVSDLKAVTMRGGTNFECLQIGFLEAAAYPGLIAVLANWYTPRELAKRVAILQSASALGAMWAGYLQAAVFAGLNGSHGLAGWKWGFIVNGCITIPVGALGFFFLPDSPTFPNPVAKRFWLSDNNIQLAKERMDEVKRGRPTSLNRKTIKKVLTTWPLWTFLLPYALFVVSGQIISFFGVWVKSTHRYTTVKTNLIPTGGYAFEIFMAILYAILSDALETRWPFVVFAASCGLFSSIVLTIWDVSFGLKFTAYLFAFATVGGSAILLTWVSEVAGGNTEARILIIAICNTLAYCFNAGLPFAMFPSSQAPHYKWGYKICLAFWAFNIVATLGIALAVRTFKNPFEADYEERKQLEDDEHGEAGSLEGVDDADSLEKAEIVSHQKAL